jgi:alkaline phosphatase
MISQSCLSRVRVRYFFFAVLLSAAADAQTRARNVILFVGDGTGIPTVNAASIHGYGKPRALYVQRMPRIALSETSSASSWVTDSAAGMTAIVTGRKTHNGVISQGPNAVRGVKDGEGLKTILEYAEERGLATGLVSNSSMADATPAACYARSNDRAKHGEIFLQVAKPRYGDGVDAIIGPGRESILKQTAALGADLGAELRGAGYQFHETLDGWRPDDAKRVVVLLDSEEFDLAEAVERALRILSRNPKGFFLMVESNNHSKVPKADLDRMVRFDRIIRSVAERRRRDSLILFTADHSFDLRLPAGMKDADILPRMKVEGSHTAEEVLVAAEGPGSERVRGILENTELFHIMMRAFGWNERGRVAAAPPKVKPTP